MMDAVAKKKQAGKGTPATVMLERSGVPYTAHPYEHNPDAESYGLEAAQALGVAPERVFKTLLANVDGVGLVVGIGLALMHTLVDATFDPNKPQPWLWFWINGAYHAVGLFIVAVIVSVWRWVSIRATGWGRCRWGY
jgi:hypothetical protein